MKKEYLDHYGNDSLQGVREAKRLGINTFMTTNQALLADKEEIEKLFLIKIIHPKEIQLFDDIEAHKEMVKVANVLSECDKGDVPLDVIYRKLKEVFVQ